MTPGLVARVAALSSLLVWLGGCGGNDSKTGSTRGSVQSVPPTRSISLHAAQIHDPTLASDKTALTLSEAAADEPPDGPTGFDIMSDGSFLVSDPLRDRLVSYDAQGDFRWELPIQYRAETVRVLNNGNLETVNAVDSKLYVHVRNGGNFGAPQVAPQGQLSAAQTDAGVAQLINASHGSVTDPPAAGQAGSPVEVFFEAPGRRLVSLHRLGKDPQGNTYVALESGGTGGTIDVQTNIRKYAPDGRPIAEIQGIASDAIVHPVEEFRQRGGVVYQMVPRANDVRIQAWDTNGVR